MASRDTFLLIADIAGYTQFLQMHRTSLAHAQDVVAQLLEVIIDATSHRLKLAKLEGDAAFFYGECRGGAEPSLAYVGELVADIYRAFHRRAGDLKLNTMCACDGCQQTGNLKIKLVCHLGEVAMQRVKHLTELAGIDVVLVHRLLKNTVPIPEYLLATEPVIERVDGAIRERAADLDLDLEGIGTTRTFYLDLHRYVGELPPPPRRSYFDRLARHLGLEARSLPYLLGLAKPCTNFRHVPPPAGKA